MSSIDTQCHSQYIYMSEKDDHVCVAFYLCIMSRSSQKEKQESLIIKSIETPNSFERGYVAMTFQRKGRGERRDRRRRRRRTPVSGGGRSD